jgi:hypothetical protein
LFVYLGWISSSQQLPLSDGVRTGVKIATNQLCYNLLSRMIEVDVLPFCKEHRIGVIAYSPLLQGMLTNGTCAKGTLDGIDKHRLRTRHFNGERELSRHGGPGHEALVLKTLAAIKASDPSYHLLCQQRLAAASILLCSPPLPRYLARQRIATCSARQIG